MKPLYLFLILIIISCKEKEGDGVKQHLKEAIDSLKLEIDSMSRALDTLQENPMEAEVSLHALKESLDSLFNHRAPSIEKRWQNEDWTVEEKRQISDEWRKLIEKRTDINERIAAHLSSVKENNKGSDSLINENVRDSLNSRFD